MKSKDVAVVGAGIIGMLTAYFLARQGVNVTVFEREPKPAMKCSKANGGQISVCNAETWNTWKNVRKGVKWMLQDDAPLLIRPSLSRDKIRWLASFLRHTFNGSSPANTQATIQLGNMSSQLYKDIIVREGLKFDQLNAGMLHVYTNERSFLDAVNQQKFFNDAGVQWEPVSAAYVGQVDTAMQSFKNLRGGILTEADWTGDAHMFCQELQKILAQNYGVQFFFDTEIRFAGKRAFAFGRFHGVLDTLYDAIVISNGHEIVKAAKNYGDKVNVYPVKGYSITIPDVGDAAPRISLLDDDKKIVSSRLGNRFRIAGTAELDGTSDHIRQERVEPLLRWCYENFPDVNLTHYEPWACLRPMNSNMMPISRFSQHQGTRKMLANGAAGNRCGRVYYHGGHGHLGWTLGAGSAFIAANEILDTITNET
jgi:D-amino-acid dehydrogenase